MWTEIAIELDCSWMAVEYFWKIAMAPEIVSRHDEPISESAVSTPICECETDHDMGGGDGTD